MLLKNDINTSEHNYGIDILRIVAMTMVVTLHVLERGGILGSVAVGTVQFGLVWFLEIASYCAVNCYALISGYVGVNAKYKISNIVLLWLRVVFYTIMFSVIFKLLYSDSMGAGQFALSFFPVLSNQYWYFTSYFILFLFIPFSNAALLNLNKKQTWFLIAFLVIAVCITKPFTTIFSGDIFSLNEGYSAFWLIILYIIGGYIRIYGFMKRIKTVVLFVLYLASVVFTWLYKYVISIDSSNMFINAKIDEIFVSYTSITVLLSAVFLLLFFERLSLKKISIKKVISFLSPMAFSVYIIHHNALIDKQFILNRFEWVSHQRPFEMTMIIIGIVIFIYVLCSAIDLIRHYLFKWLKLKERLNRTERYLRIRFVNFM